MATTPQFLSIEPFFDPDSPLDMSTPILLTQKPRRSGKDKPSPRGLLCNPHSLGSEIDNEQLLTVSPGSRKRRRANSDTAVLEKPEIVHNHNSQGKCVLPYEVPVPARVTDKTSKLKAPFQSPIIKREILSEQLQEPFHSLSPSPNKVSGRISPLAKQLSLQQDDNSIADLSRPFEMLLLDFEEINHIRSVNGDTEIPPYQSPLIAENLTSNFLHSSPVCMAFRSYTAETKFSNEFIVTNMERVYKIMKKSSEEDFFPPLRPDAQTSVDNTNVDALYRVSVPGSFFTLPSELPSQSFGNLVIEKIRNPENGGLYTRLLHTVGVDICDETGVIYKNPRDPIPRSIQILKHSTSTVNTSDVAFTKCYDTQLGALPTIAKVL